LEYFTKYVLNHGLQIDFKKFKNLMIEKYVALYYNVKVYIKFSHKHVIIKLFEIIFKVN
jgi:hypothetical protein